MQVADILQMLKNMKPVTKVYFREFLVELLGNKKFHPITNVSS